MKTVDSPETIVACDLKVGRSRQPFELNMKVYCYSRSRSFLALGPRSFTYENLNLLFAETNGPF